MIRAPLTSEDSSGDALSYYPKIWPKQENMILQMLSDTFVRSKGKTCQSEKPTKTSQLMGFLFLWFSFDLMAVSQWDPSLLATLNSARILMSFFLLSCLLVVYNS